ncbi:MAG: hypothetical protein EGQ64_01990 [Ruminococcaceae bacterium]|nr:hypothetical protein [Oscillospiraceae bacterium]
MKLFKKVLAIAMASALALTLLVGCGKDAGKTTFTVVDYLNDAAKMHSIDLSFKADTSLDSVAKNAAAAIEKTPISLKEIDNRRNQDLTAAEKKILCEAVGDTGANAEKYLYAISYSIVTSGFTTDAVKDMYALGQAEDLLENSMTLSIPDAAKDKDGNIDDKKVEMTAYVGTATMEQDGKTYLVAVFRIAVKAAK